MASPSLEHLKSPFENVLHILPQGHDKALKQAFYNTAATLFVVVVCCAAIAVYYILEAFLGPLLWAVLCGTFLHPFKNTLTSVVRGWLQSLKDSGTPLIVGTALLPLQVLDSSSTRLGAVLWKNAYFFLGASLVLPILFLVFSLWPLGEIFHFFYASFVFVYEALGYFSAIWVWSVVVGYLVALYCLWTPERASLFRLLSVPVWGALLLHLVTIAGPLRVPLFIMLVVLMAVGIVSDSNENSETAADDEDAEQDTPPSLLSKLTAVITSHLPKFGTGEEVVQDEGHWGTEDVRDEVTSDTGSNESQSKDAPDTAKASLTREQSVSGAVRERSLSDNCFIALLWAIILVQVWNHLWVIQLIPVLLACLLIKKIGAQLGSWALLQNKAKCIMKRVKAAYCSDSRSGVLAPGPIRGLANLMLRGDRKIVSTLEMSMDKFMSVLIIILLIVGLVLMSFFMVVQVQKESVHLVTVTSNVLNHTELSQWLPGNEEMQMAIDSMVGNAYVYGREWIINKLHDMLSGDDESKEKTKKEVLQVWDQVYQKWFAKNMSVNAPPHLSRQHSLMELSDVNSIWDVVEKTKDFNFNLVGFMQEHIGIMMSVLESVWMVLKGNLSLAFNLMTATVSLVFGGGTALLNFILSLVIFLTALFYLLASSGEQYKPVEWFSNLSPTQAASGNKFGGAVEEAISSVLLASLKMAVFYGLYTWWTHTLFGLQIVFIPSALAATFAAVPFLGTYIAAVPGMIELWLVREQPIEAIFLIVLHLLPASIVDTAIYSDIKGGHPYMTGLAIAGGIYWLGLQGAVIGPILLCCLVVAVNMYTSMIQPDPVTPHVPSRLKKRVTMQMQRGFSMPDSR